MVQGTSEKSYDFNDKVIIHIRYKSKARGTIFGEFAFTVHTGCLIMERSKVNGSEG